MAGPNRQPEPAPGAVPLLPLCHRRHSRRAGPRPCHSSNPPPSTLAPAPAQQLPISDKGLRKLSEGFRYYKHALGDEEVAAALTAIIQRCKKGSAKAELKVGAAGGAGGWGWPARAGAGASKWRRVVLERASAPCPSHLRAPRPNLLPTTPPYSARPG